MFNYTDLTNYLLTTARKHPNIRYVEFDTDVDAVNDPDFVCPAFIISPAPTTLLERSVVQYGFQVLFMDKLNQEENNYDDVLEAGLQFIIGYLEVVDLEYKVNMGFSIDPVLLGYDGGTMIGQQTIFTIENQYNLEKFKSVFYG